MLHIKNDFPVSLQRMRNNFDPYKTGLPVTEIIPSVSSSLATNNTLIISAPPGAGKSTVLPLALLQEPWLKDKKMIILEPRRLAAGTIANRMASLLGEQPGQTVGYRIRFENKTSFQTRIEVVTEGILTRMLHSDNALEDIGLVIFDEFHERSIHADIALALCRETQQVLRPDMRIVVMSATLDIPRLAGLLEAPVVESKGSMYPVDVIYTGEQDLQQLPEVCARTVVRAIAEREGDVLVFLPGQGEIRKCEALLKRQLRDIGIHPLYGQLSFAEQNAAIMPDPSGKRKVVLATSIAETSLTIEGIKIVVDSGLGRSQAFDPKSGLSGLKTSQISVDSADQRSGRAGRLSPGTCYRMWSLATQERMAPYRTPEILEADLASLVLDMVQWGVKDILQLTWLTPPPAAALARANEILHELNALKDNKITPHGKRIHALPCHPRIAHMLAMASGTENLALATDLAALLEERDPLEKEGNIDINLRVEALRRHRQERRKERRMDNIEKIASSYRRLFRVDEDNRTNDPYATGLLLSYAYPERIACARPGHTGQFQLANGKTAAVSTEDDLAHEHWLAVAQLDARKGIGKIFLAAPVNANDLVDIASESDTVLWDTRKGGIVATRDLRIGSIVLQSRQMMSPDQELVIEAVSEALKAEGEGLLNFTEETEQWQNRVMSLRLWRPEENWPDVSTAALLENNKRWLSSYLPQVKKTEDLKRINLVQVLQQSLPYEMQVTLDHLAPSSIRVPSGSQVKLKYHADGALPVLAVRLQEVFGMLDTPKINEGRQGVVLHLLSPGFKPVQVTSDLRSFWENAYFEVRKELKRRYPKHSWPEEPLKAEAVSGVRRK
ncbi:ATP-dependent helicase HrpB [Arcticibacter tournemirensis]|nr:ATP-dependent helicase HrpB [Arcticibacter tournemirensis]TQM52151.1 ATP-dependent helicase HrpB [Arcticibacter tournemirensis]